MPFPGKHCDVVRFTCLVVQFAPCLLLFYAHAYLPCLFPMPMPVPAILLYLHVTLFYHSCLTILLLYSFHYLCPW